MELHVLSCPIELGIQLTSNISKEHFFNSNAFQTPLVYAVLGMTRGVYAHVHTYVHTPRRSIQ